MDQLDSFKVASAAMEPAATLLKTSGMRPDALTASLSLAISAKRIADALEKIADMPLLIGVDHGAADQTAAPVAGKKAKAAAGEGDTA